MNSNKREVVFQASEVRGQALTTMPKPILKPEPLQHLPPSMLEIPRRTKMATKHGVVTDLID
jgi:hypothetical protein